MEQPVKDGISQGGIPNDVMPVVNRELTGDNGRASPVPVFEEFKHITSVLITEESMENLGMMPRRASPRPPWRGSSEFERCVHDADHSPEVCR
jgi:hypothetical protein